MKKYLKIFVIVLISVLVLSVLFEFIHFNNSIQSQVYILPDGFKGIVMLIYDQKDGSEEVLENGKLTYKIPKSGILKLKRSSAVKMSQTQHFFENNEGKRTEFYYCDPPCEGLKRDSSKVFAFGRSNGVSLNENYNIRRTIFFVGNVKDTDSLSKAAENLDIKEILINF